MAHETIQASGKEEIYGTEEDDIVVVDDDNDDYNDEMPIIEILQTNSFADRITQAMEKFASTRIGQMMMKKTDRGLKVIEDTAKWSLPQDGANHQLERPLPWIFFLTLIVCLRIFRVWLSIGCKIMGSQPVTPRSMVYYLQTRRRSLRALRMQGLKSIRNQELETNPTCDSCPNKKVTFMEKLGQIVSSAICMPGENREIPASRVFTHDGRNLENMIEPASKRPRNNDDDDEDDDDDNDHNLTVSEMLDKYASEDSDNDSDYVPVEDENEHDTSSSYVTNSSAEATRREKLDESTETENETIKFESEANSSKKYKGGEIKENGSTKHRPEPESLEENLIELSINTTADSESDPMFTPKEAPDANGVQTEEIDETQAATAEIAPQSSMSTPNTTHRHLAPPHIKESESKSTPGHESAATLKATSLPESDQGSTQDFYSVFHPAPIVKGAVNEAQTSSPTETDICESPKTGSRDNNMAAGTQRKNVNPSSHYKHNQHFNAKNRNKNRR